MDLADSYRIFHPNTNKYSFYSEEHGSLSKLDHMQGHKTNPSKFTKIEIIPYILFNHYAIKLNINNNQNSGKSKLMEIKQFITEWLVDKRRNQSIPGTKWKCKSTTALNTLKQV